MDLKKLEYVPATAYLSALKVWTTQAFIEAERFSQGEDSFGRSFYSQTKAQENPNFTTVLQLLQINEERFKECLLEIQSESIPQVLHTLWSVIGHLEIGHSSEFYTSSLTRLQNLLKSAS